MDLDRPVAVLLNALLHLFRDEDGPYELVARYMAAVPSGSFLAISHLTNDFGGMEGAAASIDEDMAAPMVLRDRAGVARFLEGLELVEPGVVAIDQWHPDGSPVPGKAIYSGAAGRKP
ncbi:MAG TPA: SAM-dependent methyltransferase [Acidimicrobiales bacterium]|nr:SAM-dependent methyltransferase [Acidimicrobiales bacterium]